jgi:hypothetical protein
MTIRFTWLWISLWGISMLCAEDFKKARFTEVIRDVKVTKADNSSTRDAKLNDWFEVPEVIRTGMDSRAEIEAPDKTIARIGANTVFSFESSKRTMNLLSGSVLFHSPKGVGGGTIKTAAATAAVTGTTIMVGATSNGGFKLMVMEGNSRVILPSGDNKMLKAGQMSYIMPGSKSLGPTLEFDLQRCVQGSDLVEGFNNELGSKGKIDQETNKQQTSFKKGEADPNGPELPDIGPGGEPKLPIPDPFTPGTITTFSFLKSYLDQQLASNLSLSSSTLSDQLNLILAGDVSGTYDFNSTSTPFSFTSSLATLAGKNIEFTQSSYDLSSFKSANTFAFIAGNGFTFPSSISILNAPTNLLFKQLSGEMKFSSSLNLTLGTDVATFTSDSHIYNDSLNTSPTFEMTVNTSGSAQKLVMNSLKGSISLVSPVFNVNSILLSGYTINLTNFDFTNYTGAKSLFLETFTGDVYASTSSLPSNPGSANIHLSSGSSVSSNAFPAGTKLIIDSTTYNIEGQKGNFSGPESNYNQNSVDYFNHTRAQ